MTASPTLYQRFLEWCDFFRGSHIYVSPAGWALLGFLAALAIGIALLAARKR